MIVRQGHTAAELIATLVVSTLVALAVSGIILYSHHRDNADPIKIEAVTPVQVHPISSEFSTGYVLVEIWTTVEDGADVPHIVRMKRSEYIELMNQSPNP